MMEMPPCRAIKSVNGAIMTEDFQTPQVNEELWHKWIQDNAINIKQHGGTLVISGTAGKPTNPEFAGFRFTGLVSKKFRSQDAVLVTRMRVPKGISEISGMARNMVHLCGSTPDYFMEVVYGKDTTERTGWFQYRLCHEGFKFFEPPVLAEESPAEFRDIKIAYSHAERRAQGFLKAGERWLPTGPPQDLFMSSLKVELKVNCPTDGVEMQAEFKDCRLYPRPSTAPIEFVVVQMPAPLYMCPEIRLRLSEGATGRLLGEGVTDTWALTRFLLPDDLTYPLACRVEAFRGDERIADVTIEAEGVEGVYPGDSWVLLLHEQAKDLL